MERFEGVRPRLWSHQPQKPVQFVVEGQAAFFTVQSMLAVIKEQVTRRSDGHTAVQKSTYRVQGRGTALEGRISKLAHSTKRK